MSSQDLHDLYSILGVSSHASADDIKAAYRAAARRFHPDVNPHQGADLQFRDIATAYETLSDTTANVAYQRTYKKIANLKTSFSTQLYTSKRILPVLEEAQIVYVLLEISPNSAEAKQKKGVLEEPVKKRHPLNIGLILDRSSSMRGIRLERVKVAAHQILEQLTSSDRLCIVSFSDYADVLVPSERVTDTGKIKSIVNTMAAGGATAIYQGLLAAFEQVKQNFNRNYVNHIILITDGRTYGDEEASLELANEARDTGIGISAMGMGDEWNDEFLDELASRTGGSSTFITSPSAVVEFLDDRIRSLGGAFAERLQLTVAPDADVEMELAFKIKPNAQPLNFETQPIQLGTLEGTRAMNILLQFQMPAKMSNGFRTIARLDVTGDILGETQRIEYKSINDQSIEVAENPDPEDPPKKILDALGKLTLYRLQQRAEKAINSGQLNLATKRLENLATRLVENGQPELAEQARSEAKRVASTKVLSEEGRKSLKFGTRLLLAAPATQEME